MANLCPLILCFRRPACGQDHANPYFQFFFLFFFFSLLAPEDSIFFCFNFFI